MCTHFNCDHRRISIHALRGEGDDDYGYDRKPLTYFNPRPPWGGRPAALKEYSCNGGISIHALRGEGDAEEEWIETNNWISIHALRGEGDFLRSRLSRKQ